MNDIKDNSVDTVLKAPVVLWVAFFAIVAMLVFMNYESLAFMVHMWSSKEEYGYGFLIPCITLFLIWQKKNLLEKTRFTGSWLGVLVVMSGLGLIFVGTVSTLYTVNQYAFLVAIIGVTWALMGRSGFRIVAVPLLLLAFMIPLPGFILNNLSAELQLVSSRLGVFFIRLFDISVYLEGNVIDLGSYKLQVVEACSGLNYLFPLMSLSFIMAYLYKAPFWKRAVVFLSSMPITILMNSFRIGAIGVLVEYGGQEQAEGFLHYFEGWVIFMTCMAILVLLMWLLGKVGDTHMSLADSFYIDFPEPTPKDANIITRSLPVTFIVSGVFVLIASAGSTLLGERNEIVPQRASFDNFPQSIGEWQGKRGSLDSIVIDALDFNDYIIGDFSNKDGAVVNFYVAYYGSQRSGQSAHSPRSCIPGGGWQIKSHEISSLDLNGDGSSYLSVNRLLIQKGDNRQLVYYWFDQRGRIITNEYLVKWYLFWDALTRNRTDGSLVRLTAFLSPGEDVGDADKRLTSFAKEVSGILVDYIPD